MSKGARGQYWTDAEKLKAVFEVFMIDRISLLLTILVGRATCDDVSTCTSPNYWYLSLITALAATPAFCLLPFPYRIIVSPWSERILFLLERLLVLFSLASAPRGSPFFIYSFILSLFSLCVAGAYFVFYLDQLSLLTWIINMFDYNEIKFLEICKGLGKNIGKIASRTAENCIREIRKILIVEYNNSEGEVIRKNLWQFFFSSLSIGRDHEEEEEEEEEEGEGEEEEGGEGEEEGEEEGGEENNKSDNRKMGTNKDEDEVNMMKKEECIKCCEYEARMVMNDKWWRDMMVDTIIETKKKQEEERRKWEEEKAQLVGKLSAAIATAELYRNLLHDGMADLWKTT
ncbi:hypothetical protein S83_010049 [Arachis hypogaea]